MPETASCFQYCFISKVLDKCFDVVQNEVALCQYSEGQRYPEKCEVTIFIKVDKITHLSEITGPYSEAFVVRNVKLTGTLGRYQV